MPFNKGDFTQQGIAGHVNANLRLNEKRLVNIDLTSNEEAEGCTIAGTVTDLLNDKVYNIGSAPSGNIEITENTAEPLNIAQYATATVNVSGGGGLDLKKTTLTLQNTSADTVSLNTVFTEAIDYFVYGEIDQKQVPISAVNTQMGVIDIVNYLKSLSIAPNETIVVELYYCCMLGGRAMAVLGVSYATNIGTSIVNMTWDSEYNEYLVTDISLDSAITIDVNDLPK